MKKRRKWLTGIVAIVIALWCSSFLDLSTAAAKPLIVAPSTHRSGSVDRSTVRKLMSGAKTQLRGKKVVLVLLPKGSSEMTWMCEDVLGLKERIYRRLISRAFFQGRIPKPLQARDVAHALQLMRDTPGALAPLDSGSLNSDTKAIYP